MPYIPQIQRNDIHSDLLEEGTDWTPENAGELNYLVTTFIDNFLRSEGVRYANVNEMIGALECCKLELYRLIIGPYEDEKLTENGAAYTVEPTSQSY